MWCWRRMLRKAGRKCEGFGDGETEGKIVNDNAKVQTPFLWTHHASRRNGKGDHAGPKQWQSRQQRKTENSLDRRDQSSNWPTPQGTPRKDSTSARMAEIHSGSHQRLATDLTALYNKVKALWPKISCSLMIIQTHCASSSLESKTRCLGQMTRVTSATRVTLVNRVNIYAIFTVNSQFLDPFLFSGKSETKNGLLKK